MMEENMKAIGKDIENMDKVQWYGQMEQSTLDLGKTTNDKVLELSNCQMEGLLVANGSMTITKSKKSKRCKNHKIETTIRININ